MAEKEQKSSPPQAPRFEMFDGAIFLFHCGLALYLNISTNKMIFEAIVQTKIFFEFLLTGREYMCIMKKTSNEVVQ